MTRPPTADDRLEHARRRIDDIDAQLVRLAAERLAAAAEAGRAKQEMGLSLVDFSREREVLDRVRGQAAGVGLDPLVAQDLVSRLIVASTSRQEAERLSRHPGRGRQAVVVGGAGRMGGWLVRFLESSGWSVLVLDPVAPSGNAAALAAVATADLVVLAVPPSVAANLCRSWRSSPPRGVVADICSVKAPLVPALRELAAAGAHVASFHPMFGPGATMLRGADVVLCRTGDAVAEALVRDLFAPTSARLVEVSLEEHDRLMAQVLSLAHATAIAFATAAAPAPVAAQSTTFRRLRDVAASVVDESPQVYYEIQAGNPHSDAALASLEDSVRRLRGIVAAKDQAGFTDLLAEGRRHIQGGPS